MPQMGCVMYHCAFKHIIQCPSPTSWRNRQARRTAAAAVGWKMLRYQAQQLSFGWWPIPEPRHDDAGAGAALWHPVKRGLDNNIRRR